MNCIVATIKSWNVENFKFLKKNDPENNWHLIDNKADLTTERIKEINPRYVFFPHWSWIIPKEVYSNYECVVFHMTDLPFGRGGSPLQNLIVRGEKDTKISALKVGVGMDTGDVYMKRDLDLTGSAEEIFKRGSKIVFSEMIPEFIKSNPTPVPQTGEVVEFIRRKPEDGDISNLDDIEKVYNYIRMLDAEGYPNAFMNVNNLRLEFEEASMRDGFVSARVKIVNSNQ
jgi:methionyl-tRNA formyltransferase